MKNFKITIVGNSIALRCRPQIEEGKNYGQYLQEILNQKYPDRYNIVENTAFSRATVIDINSIVSQQIANRFPEVYIINLGVCDASTREIPYWYAEVLNQKEDSWLRYILKNIHNLLFKKYRSFFVKLRGKRTWISKKIFRKYYKKIILELKRNSNPKIIMLSINLPDERVESILPGSHKKYIEYNKILSRIAEQENVSFISCDDLVSEIHYPDGAHYSDIGHQVLAKRILDIIER